MHKALTLRRIDGYGRDWSGVRGESSPDRGIRSDVILSPRQNCKIPFILLLAVLPERPGWHFHKFYRC